MALQVSMNFRSTGAPAGHRRAVRRPTSATPSLRSLRPLPRPSQPGLGPSRPLTVIAMAQKDGSDKKEPGVLESLLAILMGKPASAAEPAKPSPPPPTAKAAPPAEKKPEPAKQTTPTPTPAAEAKPTSAAEAKPAPTEATPTPTKAKPTPTEAKPAPTVSPTKQSEPVKADKSEWKGQTFSFKDVDVEEPAREKPAAGTVDTTPAPARPSSTRTPPVEAAPKTEPTTSEPKPTETTPEMKEPAPAPPPEKKEVVTATKEPEPELRGTDLKDFQKEVAKRAQGSMTHETKYLQSRMAMVKEHFPTSFAVDDLLFRLEMALLPHGFTGENSIGIVNLCRDEATNPLRQKIESIYPLVFNINGLGGGLTCGVTGMKAGLSHSPVFPANASGRKRYIFFSCPHIAIDSKGNVGSMSRPGQQATNCACGAMIGALGQFNAEGLEAYIKPDGVHDASDPEYSIFKQRLASRIQSEKKELKDIDLAELTKICERQISSDLDFLISQAVNTDEADYAVITGVQVHNWGEKFDNGEPNLEIVAPTAGYVVVNGKKTELDLANMPAPTPRQLSILTQQRGQDCTSSVNAFLGDSTITDINGKDVMSSEHAKKAAAGKTRERNFLSMLVSERGF